MSKTYEFVLEGNIPSVKNSKVGGRFPSKTVKKWLRLYGISSYNSKYKEVKYFVKIPAVYDFMKICEPMLEIKNYPIIVQVHFIRGTRHKFDAINIFQIIFDLWTAAGLIPDDNMDYIIPMPMKVDGKWYSYNKEQPGCIIKIIENEDKNMEN